jgi:dTMP kinase
MKIQKNFIVFEGLDGAGTTTQTRLLAEKINNTFITCEPSKNETGNFIRKILQNEVKVTSASLAYLFTADRDNHIFGDNGIIENCSKGRIVISDRYLFSSLAYQSIDVPFDKVFDLNRDFPLPEILFFLDTAPVVCQERIKIRNEKKEIFEDNLLQDKILSNYKKGISMFKNSDMKIFFLDGNLTAENILNEELEILKKYNII